MSLSPKHQELVRRMQKWCEKMDERENHIIALHNENPPLGGATPYIRGSQPDLVWVTGFNKFRFIGEAKTADDIIQDHTKKQLKAFLLELESQNFGELVLGVPFNYQRTAMQLLSSLAKNMSLKTQRWQVVTDLPAHE